MTRYLVDTTVLIGIARRNRVVDEFVQTLVSRNDELGTCAVPISEYYAGISPGDRPDMDEFVAGLQLWPMDFDTGVVAGRYRLAFRKRGGTLPPMDTLIAAVAFQRDATVLTANVRHFPMDDIRVEVIA
jgi:predicted nucleic acid-binding protein